MSDQLRGNALVNDALGSALRSGGNALGTVPALTADQWTILVELLLREQQNVLTIQTDKADVLRVSTNARPALERYLSQVADLRECIERHTGIRA